MPAGLAQPVGDGGWRLSAGETARLCLARALAARPDVLILDETTASLDPLTRRQVIAAVDRTARAVMLISHQ
jgi:ABC-type multidrug transport system fused ATPase/permease subunit